MNSLHFIAMKIILKKYKHLETREMTKEELEDFNDMGIMDEEILED